MVPELPGRCYVTVWDMLEACRGKDGATSVPLRTASSAARSCEPSRSSLASDGSAARKALRQLPAQLPRRASTEPSPSGPTAAISTAAYAGWARRGEAPCSTRCARPYRTTASRSAGTAAGKTLLRRGTILRMTWTCTLSIFKLGLCHVIFLKIFPRASHFYSE